MIQKNVNVYDLFEDDRPEEFSYQNVDGGIRIVSYAGSKSFVKIPEEINGIKVVEIGGSRVSSIYPAILLPKTLSRFDPDAFGLKKYYWITDDYWFGDVYLNEDNPYFKLEEGILYSADMSILYFCFNRTIKEYQMPNTVEIVKKGAFRAVKNYDFVKKMIWSENLRIIEDFAFFSNSRGWSNKHVRLPASVRSIASNAFPNNLESINVDPANEVYTSKDGPLYSKDMTTLFHVPRGYPISKVILPDSLKRIADHAFSNNRTISEVVLPGSLSEIGYRAFEECKQLQTINLDAVEKIGAQAFSGCEALTDVSLSCKEIEMDTFSGCSGLANVTLANTERIGWSAFEGCAINSIEFPDTLTEINNVAFKDCKFTSVTIPKTVKHVGDSAFYGSKHIYVYDSLQSNAGKIGFSYSHERPHIITVLSADNDQIKFSVPMYPDGSGAHSRLLRSSWGPNATFKFRTFDNYFANIKGAWIKLSTAISRLKNPFNLLDTRRQTYVAYVVRNAKAVMKDFIDANDLDSFTFFESFGTIKKANIDELIEYAVNKQAVAFSAFLMNYKEKNFPSKVSTKRSLSLGSIRTVTSWRMTRNTIDTVGRYRGSDVDVIFPTEVRGNVISKISNATVTVPDNYKEIVSVVIPEGYVSIGDNAFRGCEKLERISLPSTLKKLGKCAFAGCGKLQEVELPKGIKYIEEECFYDSGLKTAIFHGCDPWISTSAFRRDVRFIGNKHIPGQRISDSWLGSYAKFIEINPNIEYEGKLFVFSGLGIGNAKDHEIVQSVIRKGGLFRSSVSGKTDYLIVSPENAGITKIDAAIKQKKKGSSIKVIALEDLISILDE